MVFFSTPFDEESAVFLNKIQNIFKISSGDNDFFNLIEKVLTFNKPIIISTGMMDFKEVKRLALSKWNFHNYSPGLVGGHCLPVDPYYLAHIAKQKNYPSKVILSGREINNGMEKYIINKIIKITST